MAADTAHRYIQFLKKERVRVRPLAIRVRSLFANLIIN